MAEAAEKTVEQTNREATALRVVRALQDADAVTPRDHPAKEIIAEALAYASREYAEVCGAWTGPKRKDVDLLSLPTTLRHFNTGRR